MINGSANGKGGDIFAEAPGVALSIPGPWADPGELNAKLAVAGADAFALEPPFLIHTASGKRAMLEVYERDEALIEAMKVGAGGVEAEDGLAPDDEARLRAHATVAGITLEDVGDDLADDLALFSGVLERADGIAVMVDKSGVAHAWQRWNRYLAEGDFPSLYYALLMHVGDDGLLTTFGMKQFALPDCAVDRVAGEDDERNILLAQFNAFQVAERPELEDDDIFALAQIGEEVHWTLRHQDDGRYPRDHYYFNPNGVWRLEPEDD